MNRFANIKMPQFSAALNVAHQLKNQIIPSKSRNNAAEGDGSQIMGQQASGHGERVHFAQLPNNQHHRSTHGGVSNEHHEMMMQNSATTTTTTTTNPFGNNSSNNNPFLQNQMELMVAGDTGGCRMEESQFNNTAANNRSKSDGGILLKQQSRSRINSTDLMSEGSDDFVEGKSDVKINEYQAAWNVTNAIQGMFIVSLPFAVQTGGYWAIGAMILVAQICCYTGKILVDCLYEIDLQTGRRIRVRDSYVAIAKECFGKNYGSKIVSIAQIIELLMTCILYVVVCGDLLIGTFPEGAVDTRSWMMFIGIFLLPLGFLKSLKSVSLLSFWCTMSHIFINIIIIGYCLMYIGEWGWGNVKWTLDLKNFPISLGVIVFSYTSQIFLPTLEGNMIDPSKFDWMLDWSHVWAAIFKAVFGYICFLTFQNDTQQVITNNLHSAGFKGLVNSCLVMKALLSYPLPYYAACELLERSFFRGQPKTRFPSIWDQNGDFKVWGLAWRIGIVLFTILMACFIPHFQILMGFIGSFTGTMLSFIWPAYFHIKLKGNTLDRKRIIYDYFIIYLGCIFGVIGIFDSGRALIDAFSIGLPF